MILFAKKPHITGESYQLWLENSEHQKICDLEVLIFNQDEALIYYERLYDLMKVDGVKLDFVEV
jgi:hypothetical protein